MAELDVGLSWRWMYWFYVPIALLGLVLVWRYFRPDRPPQPMHLPIDWLAVTLFVAWVVAIVFAFSWYRKWGGWTSNAFAVTVILCVTLPVVLVVWLGSGFSPDEHLKRLLRTRVFILAMTTRGLMLTHLVARADHRGPVCHRAARLPPDHGRLADGADHPDDGLHHVPDDLVPPAPPAARLAGRGGGGDGGLRVVAVVAGQLHPKEHVAVILACWGAFLGLIPPVFLTDEIEGLNPKDFLYAGTLAVVGLVMPIITVPTATGTMIKAWSDRALDTYRLNLSTNRPAVSEAGDRVADYYRQRGLSGPALQQETGTVLGTFATVESVALGSAGACAS